MSLKYYSNINDFLDALGAPQLILDGFYILKFEDHNFDINLARNEYKHDYFEILLTLRYNTYTPIEDQTKNVIDYNLSFTSPGQPVNIDTLKMKGRINYMILFKPEFLPFATGLFSLFETFPYFNNFILPSYQLTAQQKMLFKRCFQDIYEEYQLGEMATVDILKSYLTALLFKAKRELQFSTAISYLKSRRQEITFNFENLIKQTRQKHQPIKYYAELLNISPIYLSECIKKVSDKTAKQIIDEYLVLEAKSLLKLTSKTICEIANQLGFDDGSNFVKYFKKQTGLTPKQYKIYA